jgi:hypothetical protein
MRTHTLLLAISVLVAPPGVRTSAQAQGDREFEKRVLKEVVKLLEQDAALLGVQTMDEYKKKHGGGFGPGPKEDETRSNKKAGLVVLSHKPFLGGMMSAYFVDGKLVGLENEYTLMLSGRPDFAVDFAQEIGGKAHAGLYLKAIPLAQAEGKATEVVTNHYLKKFSVKRGDVKTVIEYRHLKKAEGGRDLYHPQVRIWDESAVVAIKGKLGGD